MLKNYFEILNKFDFDTSNTNNNYDNGGQRNKIKTHFYQDQENKEKFMFVIYRQGYQVEDVKIPVPVFKQVFETKSIEEFEKYLEDINKENSWDEELSF